MFLSAFTSAPDRLSAVSDSVCLNILPLAPENATIRLTYVKELYAQSKEDTQSWDSTMYVFVVRNKDVFETIAEAEIPFKHKIAYVTGDVESNVKIKYYSTK